MKTFQILYIFIFHSLIILLVLLDCRIKLLFELFSANTLVLNVVFFFPVIFSVLLLFFSYYLLINMVLTLEFDVQTFLVVHKQFFEAGVYQLGGDVFE